VDRICSLYRVLGDSLDLSETLATFDRELRRAIPYEAISVHLMDGGRLMAAYSAGRFLASLLPLETAEGKTFLEVVVQTCRPALNYRLTHLPELHHALVMPLYRTDSVVAVLALYHSGQGVFAEDDLRLIEKVAPKLASAIENARLYESVAKLSGVDPYTSALNARSMFLRLDAELSRSRRRRDKVAVVQCVVEGIDEAVPDLRHNVLRQVAGILREHCREYDSVAWMGDRFVLVIAGLGSSDFEEKRANLQTAVEQVGFQTGLPLSITAGAAFFPEEATNSEGLLSAAEARLHRRRQAQLV